MARWICLLAVLLGLGVYGMLAWSSAGRMALTSDEPLHIAGAIAIAERADYRINPEDPAGLARVAGLGLRAGDWTPEFSGVAWEKSVASTPSRWEWTNRAVCGGAELNQRIVQGTRAARLPMLCLALGLGAATAWLAWLIGGRQAGTWAAVVAVCLFTFEPTVLGHGALVKNDVPLALGFTLVGVALVMLWRRLTWWGVLLLAVAAAWSVSMKFSGLLLGPGVMLALAVRACWPASWELDVGFWRGRMRWWGRLLALPAVGLLCLGVVWSGVWAVYGFRYSITPDPALRATATEESDIARAALLWKRGGLVAVTPEAIATEPVPGPMRWAQWASGKRWVPEAFARGFTYTYATTIVRSSYLLDELTFSGRWQYFPIAVGVKWPLGLLALVALALAVAWWRWSAEMTGVAVLAGFYLLLAVTGGLNLGIRHLLPAIPIVLALLAVVAGRQLQIAWESRKRLPRQGRVAIAMAGVMGVAWLGMVGEVVGEMPRFLSFFNAPARSYGPHRILGDSNLDWGQDLPLLREWQLRNPDVVLSLSYFGTVSAEAYGIKYLPANGTSMPRRPTEENLPPGVLAVSVSHLQEILVPPAQLGLFAHLRRLQPIEVLGGTIFLFRIPPSEGDSDPKRWPMRFREQGGVRELGG
jgi:hypothetical protein